jgi:hypothetical protein
VQEEIASDFYLLNTTGIFRKLNLDEFSSGNLVFELLELSQSAIPLLP